MKTKVTTETTTEVKVDITAEETQTLDEKVTPKGQGKLDMVIAFDTTGSMAAYIDDVRHQVADMIPRLLCCCASFGRFLTLYLTIIINFAMGCRRGSELCRGATRQQ